MAVYQFKLSLVPRAYFERNGLLIPDNLTEEDLDRGESESVGWWKTTQPSPEGLSRLRKLYPTDQSWGETEEYVTSGPFDSDLRIWRENSEVWQITLRFSASDSTTLLREFVAIARSENCLLLDRDARVLLIPDDAVIERQLQASKAMRFVRDPKGTILDSAKETPQE